MKRACLSFGVGLACLLAATVPGRAQEFAAPTPASAVVVKGEPAAPLMLVYVVKPDDNVLPRLALGMERPALTIAAFDKCVRVSTENSQYLGIAVQLKAEDTKAMVAAIKALGAPDARELPNVIIWFAAPDNKALDYINTGNVPGVEANLVKGVILFRPKEEEPVFRYLSEKLHPE